MPSEKTRPIGEGKTNVPVTLPNEELAEVTHLAKLSGVGRSPYLRELARWAVRNRVVLVADPTTYSEHLAAIKHGEKSKGYGYEVVITRLDKPVQVLMEPGDNVIPLHRSVSPATMRVAESPHPPNPRKAQARRASGH